MTKYNISVTLLIMDKLDTLMQLQKSHELTNKEMADKLKRTRVSWYRIRRRLQPVTPDVCFNAAIAFPEQKDIFLSTEFH